MNISIEEDIVTIVPEKKYSKGYDLEISLHNDMVVFSIGTTDKNMMNVQIDKEEMKTLLTLIKLLGELYV
jgi:hypothetical protein